MNPLASQHVMGPQGLAFVITKFVGKNFHFWKFKIQTLLENKEFWSIVSWIELILVRDFAKWEKRNRKARTFIIGLHDSLPQNVRGAKTTKETWDSLLKVYETKDLANKLFLNCQCFAYTMNPTNSMLDHINKTKSMAY
jgi:hypothetical protein